MSRKIAGEDEAKRLEDALKMVLQTVRNSPQAPNVLDTIDYIARTALHPQETDPE